MTNRRLATTQTVLFVAALVLFFFSASKSLNIYDLFTYADGLKKSFETKDVLYPLFHSFGPYGGGNVDSAFSRSSMYVVISYAFSWLFSHKLGFDIEFVLNSLSALIMAAGSIFVYKTARIFLNYKKSLAAWAIYILTPYIFFNAVNASPWPLQLLFSSAWLYFLISGIKHKDEKRGLISTALLFADIFTYLSSITLIIAHFYGLYKIKKKTSWLIINALALSPVALLLHYFTAVHPAYPFSFSALRYVFMFLLLAWESVNALSVGMFVALMTAFYGLFKKSKWKNLDSIERIFLMSLIPTFSGLAVFVYNPIFIFNAIFIFLPLLIVKSLQKYKKFNMLLILILVFAVLKSVPIYTNFHLADHPHKDFALWLNAVLAPGSTIVVGHECPAVKYYTNFAVVCRGEIVNVPSGAYVTSQYFKNENQLELEYMNDYAKNVFGFSAFNSIEDYIARYDILSNRTFEKVASYDGKTRNMEDSYELFFSVYPDPVINLFYNTEFPKVKYELFRIVQ